MESKVSPFDDIFGQALLKFLRRNTKMDIGLHNISDALPMLANLSENIDKFKA
jgi:hypothetical protein